MCIDLFFPANGGFDGLSVRNVGDDQSTDGNSTEKFVDASDARVLPDKVP